MIRSRDIFCFKMECDIIEMTVYRTTCKGQVSVQMHIICQNSTLSSAIDAVDKAVSLLCLKQEKNRINKRIQSLLHIADDLAPDSVEYQCVYERILELERMRELIRRIRKAKCAQIYAQLHMLWVNRVKKASRTTAGLTTDPMSIAMPIPPTFEATLSSFGRGRDLDALAC